VLEDEAHEIFAVDADVEEPDADDGAPGAGGFTLTVADAQPLLKFPLL
jgi:hypothetical protein